MVTSSSSIFCQTRCAVARLRPWKEIRSIRATIWSAVRPPSTTNGSIGVCRKRDVFFVIRRTLNHKKNSQLSRLRSSDLPVWRRSLDLLTFAGLKSCATSLGTRDVLEKHEIAERRDVDADERVLRDDEVGLVPEADVR